jgi:hypothetical protein
MLFSMLYDLRFMPFTQRTTDNGRLTTRAIHQIALVSSLMLPDTLVAY